MGSFGLKQFQCAANQRFACRFVVKEKIARSGADRVAVEIPFVLKLPTAERLACEIPGQFIQMNAIECGRAGTLKVLFHVPGDRTVEVGRRRHHHQAAGADGLQLVNWVAEIETPRHPDRDWNRVGRLEDFIGAFQDWHFDWLDVPRFIRAADTILEFPMIDQDPLPWWSERRVTLLGDAAHPMVPRGSNGAGQAILDARVLADSLAAAENPVVALKEYEDRRLEPTANVVRMSRTDPPDAILREVYQRTGDRPFTRIEEVISSEELAALSEGYKRVAGYDRESLRGDAR